MSFPPPERAPLERADLDPDPFAQFGTWFRAAARVVALPEAMTLATVDESGSPDARMVLLKGFDQDGFRFFTNYEGTKARQLDSRPEAALVFFWSPVDRQVRIRGTVERLEAEASDAYFATRDRGSQIGAWASPQSRALPDERDSLEELAVAALDRFGDGPVPRPPHWGGYVIAPLRIEFWQGRGARLHDRFEYRRSDLDGPWEVRRLAP